MNPRAMRREPKTFSTLEVMETAFACRIDDTEVCRRRQVERPSRCAQLAGPAGHIARNRFSYACLMIDHRGARPEITGIEQVIHGDPHKVGIRQVKATVGVGQAACLGDQMHCLDRAWRQRTHVEVVEDSQDLQHGHPARSWRRHAAYPVGPVGTADRFSLDRTIAGKVVFGEQARIRCGADHANDLPRQRPAIECVGAACRDRPQNACVFRIPADLADTPGAAVRVIEVAPRPLLSSQMLVPGDQHVEAR